MTALVRIYAIIRKEICHILRDWQTLWIIIAMPVFMMFLYGYALTLDLKELPVMVEDPSASVASRYLIQSIDASTIFHVVAVVPAAKDPALLFKTHGIKALFKLPVSFNRDIRSFGRNAHIQVLIDGSDPNTGTIIRNMVGPLVQKIVLDIIDMEPPELVTVQPRVLYNPEQKSALFFVPGLIAIILIMISAMLTSLTLTKEKETGTLEELLISPLRPWEIIIGKIIPYILLAAADFTLILIVGRINFGVTVTGSIALLALGSLIYIITSLALGIIFSTLAKNRQQAMMMVIPATMLPTIILSGFIFPVASMPWPLRAISQVIPATYFLIISRAVILKGVGFDVLWQPMAILLGIGIFFIMVSIKKFRVRL